MIRYIITFYSLIVSVLSNIVLFRVFIVFFSLSCLCYVSLASIVYFLFFMVYGSDLLCSFDHSFLFSFSSSFFSSSNSSVIISVSKPLSYLSRRNFGKLVDKGYEDGLWKGHSTIEYGGTANNGSEYVYFVYNYYTWSGDPWSDYKDTLIIGWQDIASPTGRSSVHNVYYTWMNMVLPDSEVNIEDDILGAKCTFNIRDGAVKQSGYFKQHLRFPASAKGKRVTILAGYFHPYFPGDVTISLGPTGITFSDSGMKKSWTQTFVIGDTFS